MKRVFLVAIAAAVSCVAYAEPRRVAEDGTITIDSRELAPKVYGYGGVTPIRLYVDQGVVCGVEMLPNSESRAYFRDVEKKFTDYWTGLTLQEVVEQEVDVVSGASMSSEAIIENVKAAARYELEQEKKSTK